VQAAAATHARHPRLRRQMHALIDHLFRTAAAGMAAYQRQKEELGLLDYVDQEVLALQLLRRDDVRVALADKIDLVLVDEFQDTSPLQLAIFSSWRGWPGSQSGLGIPSRRSTGSAGPTPS
jgi:ATP-dependent exoDNAse (exonuclease V) beta subunit